MGYRAFLKADRGFSLLEVLIALGVISIVGLAFGSMISQNLKMLALIEQKSQADSHMLVLKAFLSQSQVCKANVTAGRFSSISQVPTTEPAQPPEISQILDLNNLPLAEVGQAVGGVSGSVITQMNISDIRAIVANQYSAKLNVSFESNPNSGNFHFVRSFPLILVTDGGRNLLSCSSGTADSSVAGGSSLAGATVDPNGKCAPGLAAGGYRRFCNHPQPFPAGFPTQEIPFTSYDAGENCKAVCLSGQWQIQGTNGRGGS